MITIFSSLTFISDKQEKKRGRLLKIFVVYMNKNFICLYFVVQWLINCVTMWLETNKKIIKGSPSC